MAQQETEIPLATIEKLDKECHDSALDLAQDIARNLNIQTQAGESIQGESGDKGDSGNDGQDGQDGADGTDGITPRMVQHRETLIVGQSRVEGSIPILTETIPIVEFFWGDDTVDPTTDPPTYYLQENASTSKTDVIFRTPITETWSIRIGYYTTSPE